MKKAFRIVLLLFMMLPLSSLLAFGLSNQTTAAYNNGNYTLILEGYDWGPAVKKVVLPMHEEVTAANSADFHILVERSAEGVVMKPEEASGERQVLFAYISDEKGNRIETGKYISLVLMVHPNNPLDSPIKYIFKDGRGSNSWIDYKMKITHMPTSKIWDMEANRIYEDVDRFDLSGRFTSNGISLTYASFEPSNHSNKIPLIIWLHGGGEGGTDPSIPLVANMATNYATPEIQAIFGDAYVLVPQTPSFWMQSATGDYTRGKSDDVYHQTLFDMIGNYVTGHPNIDTDRIYIGGCSNGGYMSLKLLLEHPDYFAAGYISALAYQNQYITDQQIQRIKNIPMWFVHSKDDTTTLPDETVVPLYKRLMDAKAPNVHFSYYDHVIDLTGVYGGQDYYFPGHWSWIYSHANDANFDYDNEPVILNGNKASIMEWLAAQKK